MMAVLLFFFSLNILFFIGSGEIFIYLLTFVCVVSMILLFFFYTDFFSLLELGLFNDGLSINLVMLSFWITLLMSFSSYKIFRYSEFYLLFNLMIYFLGLALIITFMLGNYLLFYFFFEISLIPTFFIIMGWGYQPERLQAGIYFIFYTLTASLPLLIGIFYVFNSSLSLNFFSSTVLPVITNFSVSVFFSLCFIFAFLVKLPMFYVHLWLPSAHVEAPVAGSMILAGVLLKLGGYGAMRVGLILFNSFFRVSSYLFGLSLVGMIFIGFICCRLNDFKALVAYSSVAHMGMVICGIVTLFLWGFEGSLMLMISHGVASSGLFCMVNMYYERMNSRSFFINKGLLFLFPIFSLMIFLLSAANIAAPPTINLMSEIFLMGSMMGFDVLMVLVFPIGSFLGAVFTIFMFSFTQHGKIYYSGYSFSGVNFRELHTLFLHLFPVNFLILGSPIFLSG